MTIKKSELAWISVSDINKAKKFFNETLGLPLTVESPEYGWLELTAPESSFVLGVGKCEKNTPVQPGNNAVVTFSVDDIVATKAAFEKKGVRFIGDIMEVPGHVKMALFVDFDGNHFQLVQKLD